jgi:hypothetical protein
MPCLGPACAKRIFQILFLLMLPVMAKAQFQYSTNFTYVTNNAVITTNGSITITNYTGVGGMVTIPNTIGSYPVTEIGPAAFENSALTYLAIGTNVTSIDSHAFSGSENLINATIPSSVVNIGTNAFDGCGNLGSIIIPGSVTNISDNAFAQCYSLSGIYFEGNAPNIGNLVFALDPVTVYYLAQASGWANFADDNYIATALWLPQIEMDSSFGFQTNQFGFDVFWASGQSVVVEASTNIASQVWPTLQTNAFSGNFVYFSDAHTRNYRSRFYQVLPQ